MRLLFVLLWTTLHFSHSSVGVSGEAKGPLRDGGDPTVKNHGLLGEGYDTLTLDENDEGFKQSIQLEEERQKQEQYLENLLKDDVSVYYTSVESNDDNFQNERRKAYAIHYGGVL